MCVSCLLGATPLHAAFAAPRPGSMPQRRMEKLLYPIGDIHFPDIERINRRGSPKSAATREIQKHVRKILSTSTETRPEHSMKGWDDDGLSVKHRRQ